MARFKVGDRCRVVRNTLAQKRVGEIVEIAAVILDYFYETREEIKDADGNVLYCLQGYASEKCLEPVDDEQA